MKVGAVYPQIELGGDSDSAVRFATAAEDLGYAHLSAYDHPLGAEHANRDPPLRGPYTQRDPFHDPLVMFAYLAGITKKLEFVPAVLVLPQRQAALVARQAADLDLFSGGRLRIGVGSGWNYLEYLALSTDFATRGPRLEEQVEVMRRLWTEDLVSYEGRFHKLDRVASLPKPKRSIPIWFGARAEVAYRRAGRIGDGFIGAFGIEHAIEAWSRIKFHLEAAGRDPSSFGRDLIVQPGPAKPHDEAFVRETVLRWRDAGGTHATVGTIGRGFRTVEEHVDFIARIKRLLDE